MWEMLPATNCAQLSCLFAAIETLDWDEGEGFWRRFIGSGGYLEQSRSLAWRLLPVRGRFLARRRGYHRRSPWRTDRFRTRRCGGFFHGARVGILYRQRHHIHARRDNRWNRGEWLIAGKLRQSGGLHRKLHGAAGQPIRDADVYAADGYLWSLLGIDR